MYEKKLIVIGDIIKSSKKFHPEKWGSFEPSIKDINRKFKFSLLIPFTIYSGDSFGAVCKDVVSATEIILAIQETQKHQQSRFVLIEDEITYGMEQKNFLTLQGPALWKSEEKLTFLKKKKQLFLADLENTLLAKTVHTIVNFILSVRNEWNEQEWAIYKNYAPEVKQQDLAEEMGITQQYVSKIIRQSRLRLIKEAEENLKTIINGINSNIN